MTKTIEKLYLASVFNQKTFVYYLFFLYECLDVFTWYIRARFEHMSFRSMARLLRCDFWVLLCLFYDEFRELLCNFMNFSNKNVYVSEPNKRGFNSTYGTWKCINNYRGIRILEVFLLSECFFCGPFLVVVFSMNEKDLWIDYLVTIFFCTRKTFSWFFLDIKFKEGFFRIFFCLVKFF